MKKFQQIDLYPVVTESFCSGRSSLEVCRAVIAGGAKIIQLREKDKEKSDYIALARQVCKLAVEANVLVMINDQVEIALEVNADGVHLGQEDMPVMKARSMAPGLLIGLSTHNIEEATMAEKFDVDYINIGPVFTTQTKMLPFPALGVKAVQDISRLISLPFTVMGGIHEGNMHEVLKIGADKLAMVTAITQAQDISNKVRDLRQQILKNK